MANVVFHPEAQAEFDETLVWYRKRSLRAAQRFSDEVERALELTGQNPGMFPSFDEEHRYARLRRFPYSLIYHELNGQCYVVAVAHASRRAGYWQGRTADGS